MRKAFRLGWALKDRVSGLSGIAMKRTEHIYGTIEYTLYPLIDPQTLLPIPPQTFNAIQLDYVSDGILEPQDVFVPDLQLRDFELSTRVFTCLKFADIHTLKEMLACTIDQLMALPNFGPTCASELGLRLHEYGWTLAEEATNGLKEA